MTDADNQNGAARQDERALAVARARESFFPTKFAPGLPIGDGVDSVFRTYIARSYLPAAPMFGPDAKIASIGSCFAEEISTTLRAQGLQVAHVFLSERWNTAFALAHFLEKALFDTPFPEGYVIEKHDAWNLPEGTREQFLSADLFILTFGLSLCWFEKASGRMVLEPGDSHTLTGLKRTFSAYEMRQTGVAENEQQILRCIDLIRKVRPDAKIVVTLSPVPLLAAVTDVAPIAANIVSKAMLRAALANVTARNLKDVYYWPSYDLIAWFGAHVEAAFVSPHEDMRHVRRDLVDRLARFFKQYFFKTPE